MRIAVEHYTFSVGLPHQRVVAFVSDLHHCENAPILAVIESSGVDAVLVGGDVIHNELRYQRGLDFLAACAARCPTFCSVGNHERYCGNRLRDMIAPTGAVLLDNDMVEWNGILLGGLSSGQAPAASLDRKRCRFWWRFRPTPPPDLDFLARFAERDGYKLLLSHHPEYWARYVRQTNVQLTLSGHAHGGQWRVLGRGVFAPGQGIFPRYTSGLYERRLLVSRGIGNPHRIPRICNRPVVCVLHFA